MCEKDYNLEERVKKIREIIQSDTEEYARVPSLRDLASEMKLSMEEVAEAVIELPVDEFCDFISFLSQYEWEVVSHISEMKSKDHDETMFDEDGEDYTLMQNFQFMT